MSNQVIVKRSFGTESAGQVQKSLKKVSIKRWPSSLQLSLTIKKVSNKNPAIKNKVRFNKQTVTP